jgi:twitching motility protein PilJ
MSKQTRDDMLAASLMEGRRNRKTETFKKDAKRTISVEDTGGDVPDASPTKVQRSMPGVSFFKNLRQRDRAEKPAEPENVWQDDEDMDWAFVEEAKTVVPDASDNFESSHDESVIALANAVAEEQLAPELKKKAGLFSFFKQDKGKSQSTSEDSVDLIPEDKPTSKGLFGFFKKNSKDRNPAATAILTTDAGTFETVDVRSEAPLNVSASSSKLLLDKPDTTNPPFDNVENDDLLASLRSTTHDAIDSMIASKWGNEAAVPATPVPVTTPVEAATTQNYSAQAYDTQAYNSQVYDTPSVSSSLADDMDIDDLGAPILEFDPVPAKTTPTNPGTANKTNWDLDDEDIVNITSPDLSHPVQVAPPTPKPKTAWDVNDDALEVTAITKRIEIPSEPDVPQEVYSNDVYTDESYGNESYSNEVAVIPLEGAEERSYLTEDTSPVSSGGTSTQDKEAEQSRDVKQTNFATLMTAALPEQAPRRAVREGGITFADIPVAQKLALLAIPLLLGVFLVWLVGRNGLELMRYHANTLYDNALIPITALKDAETAFTVLLNDAEKLANPALPASERDALIASFEAADERGDATLERYNSEWVTTLSPEFTANLRGWGQLGLQEQEVALLGRINEIHEEAEEAFHGYLESVRAGTPNLSELRTGTESYRNVLSELKTLTDINLQFAQLSAEDANRGYSRSNLATLLTFLASIGLGALLVYLLSRTITRPLNQLGFVADRLAQGDLSQLAEVDSRDEIGTVAKSFNQAISQLRVATEQQEQELLRGRAMQQNIGQFLDVAQEIAQGDLTKRGQVTDDVLGNVVDAINLMTEEFALLLQDVQKAATSVNQGSDEMLLTTDEIAQKAQQQAAEAQRARENVIAVVKGIRWMAQNATTSAEAAQRTLQASQLGQQAVSGTLRGMQTLRQDVQGMAERVQQLGKRSQEISEIVGTISDIASQTNLLALGAALEAAGAGESGRRFSVVAEEVGLLAERSAQAAQRVSALINNIQRDVREVVGEVEKSTQEAEQGYRIAAQAGQRLEEISDISKQSAMLAETISQATAQQVQSVEQVGQVVQGIAGISQESQQTVLQGREAAERLRLLAAQLSDSLSRFRLN